MKSLLSASIDRLLAGDDSSAAEVEAAILAILDGEASDAQIGGWLVAMRAHGENSEALVGGARALLCRATKVPALGWAVDTCGTGGDGQGSLNISTLAAFVLAAAGVPVSKHGNRSVSSRTGSADLIAALGINLEAPLPDIVRGFDELGLAFLFAPRFHPTLRRVAAVRKELGIRTVFNLLGPLCNPAETRFRVVGVFDARWLEPMARALSDLGVERAVVLCGEGGLDEPHPEGKTHVIWVDRDQLTPATLTPQDFGLRPARLSDLGGGRSPVGARSSIVMTAALGLHLFERTPLLEAAAKIERTLDIGAALSLVDRWRATQAESGL